VDARQVEHAAAYERDGLDGSELAHVLPAIHADRVSMQQVILSLVESAMDAAGGNGEAEKTVLMRTSSTAITSMQSPPPDFGQDT
jgi:uncharacterized protein YbjQ (UPF0145 family)